MPYKTKLAAFLVIAIILSTLGVHDYFGVLYAEG
jgi:hypothetical protein